MAIEHRCAVEDMRDRHYHTPLDLCHIDALQIQSRPLPGACFGCCPAMNLNAADTRRAPLRENFNLIISPHVTCNQSSGYNRSKSFHRETAIDRQTKKGLCILRPNAA